MSTFPTRCTALLVDHAIGDFWDAIVARWIVGDRGGAAARRRRHGARALLSGRRSATRRTCWPEWTALAVTAAPRSPSSAKTTCVARSRGRAHRPRLRLRRLPARNGVGPGDRVAAWLPNTPEVLVAMLGTSLVGGVFTSTSPDFGVAGVLDRFGQVEPTVLVGTDGYVYAGKPQPRLERLAEVAAGLPSVEVTVVVGELEPIARPRQLGTARALVRRPRKVHSCRGQSRCACQSPPRDSSSTAPGPREHRSASCTAVPALRSSTPSSSGCTATSGQATSSSTSPPAAG